MTLLITRFPLSATDDPLVWRVIDGQWQTGVALSDFMPDAADEKVLALVSPADARCTWHNIPDLEPRQAEGVARLRATEQSLGLVHMVARHVGGDVVVTAGIATALMQQGLARLAVRGLNPDIVIPFGLSIDFAPDHIVRARFDDMSVLRGSTFTMPDEQVFHDMLVGEVSVEELDFAQLRNGLVLASDRPLLNLREGMFEKRTPKILITPEQRKWLIRITVALLIVTLLLAVVTLAKYWNATSSENSRALASAQKIDASIQDVTLAEAQLARALQQKGLSNGRFAPLTASLWKAVQATPNVSVRELRFGSDSILVVILAAPDTASINKALIALQQDGFRITATPRQDNSGATLVDLTVRMP